MVDKLIPMKETKHLHCRIYRMQWELVWWRQNSRLLSLWWCSICVCSPGWMGGCQPGRRSCCWRYLLCVVVSICSCWAFSASPRALLSSPPRRGLCGGGQHSCTWAPGWRSRLSHQSAGILPQWWEPSMDHCLSPGTQYGGEGQTCHDHNHVILIPCLVLTRDETQNCLQLHITVLKLWCTVCLIYLRIQAHSRHSQLVPIANIMQSEAWF